MVELHRRNRCAAVGAEEALEAAADPRGVVAGPAVRAVHVAHVAVAAAAPIAFCAHVVAVRLVLPQGGGGIKTCGDLKKNKEKKNPLGSDHVARDGVVAARAVPPRAVGAEPLGLLGLVRGEADGPRRVADAAVVRVRVPRRGRPHHAALEEGGVRGRKHTRDKVHRYKTPKPYSDRGRARRGERRKFNISTKHGAARCGKERVK